MTEKGLCQLRVFSFDFHQPAHSDQSRKTRFFRHLYGHTQRIKKRLKDGQVTTYSYHYPGILDQIPHIKLGKSVFGILPGTENLVLDLFQSYSEVIVHQFIGMIPIPLWLSTGGKTIFKTNQRIVQYGFLSILDSIVQSGGLSQSKLVEMGFDYDYVISAVIYLLERGLIRKEEDNLLCTERGRVVAEALSDLQK